MKDINKAVAPLTKLFPVRELPTNVKTHLIKILVLPAVGTSPIPTHAISNKQLRSLQKNKPLRFVTNQTYPYTLNTMQIHEHTKTRPVNIRLHDAAVKVWKQLDFPSSLQGTENKPNSTVHLRRPENQNNAEHRKPSVKYPVTRF